MLLSYNEAKKTFVTQPANEVYLQVKNGNPLFWEAMAVTPLDTYEYRSEYVLDDDDYGDNNTLTDTPLTNVNQPNTFPTDKLKLTYNRGHVEQVAKWNLTQYFRSIVSDDNETLLKGVDYFRRKIALHIELIARELIGDVIRRSAIPATPTRVGSIAANLNGWVNGYGETLGFNPTILTNQSLAAPAGLIFDYDATAGGITIGNEAIFRRAARLVPGCNLIVMPFRCYESMILAYQRGLKLVNEASFMIDNAEMLPTNLPMQRVPSWNGIPILVVEDITYAAAGHNVAGAHGAADYDVYFLRVSANQELGCGLRFFQNGITPANLGQNQKRPLDMGLSLEYLGVPMDGTGSWATKVDRLSWLLQFSIGRPDGAARVTGVKD